MDWFEECYCADEKDWRYSPLVKSQAGMPPTLVVTASLDPIRDQGRAYAAACIEAGVRTIFIEAEGNDPRLHQPEARDPLLRRGHRGCVAALKLLLGEARRMTEQGRPSLSPRRRRDAAQPRGQGVGRPAAR